MTKAIDLPRIMKELKIDVPVYLVRKRGTGVELHLYGGKVVTWEPQDGDRFPVTSDQQALPLVLQNSNIEQKSSPVKPIERQKMKRRIHK